MLTPIPRDVPAGPGTGRGPERHMLIQSDAEHLPLEDKSVDLTFGSPPYCDARTYGIGAQRGCVEWVEWMVRVTLEAQRVTRGPVIWVAAGVTRDRNYWPACEGLMWEWWKRGGDCQLYRPAYWNRVGIPGSGGKDWLRADVEYVMCFKRPGPLAWSDNTAMGHPPKWAPGGAMSHRLSTGARVNQWGHSIDSGATVTDGDFVRSEGKRPSHVRADAMGFKGRTIRTRPGKGRIEMAQGTSETDGRPLGKICGKSRRPNGEMKANGYDAPVLANPGNLIKVIVGGGTMGSKLAHENEAPFPEALAEFFIRSFCPPGGTVLDPFSGSGTTVAVALKHGRNGIGSDLRESQVELGRRRVAEALTGKPAKAKRNRAAPEPVEQMLFGGAA